MTTTLPQPPAFLTDFPNRTIEERMQHARDWGTYDGLTGANNGADRFVMWIAEGNAYRAARDAARR